MPGECAGGQVAGINGDGVRVAVVLDIGPDQASEVARGIELLEAESRVFE